VDILEYLAIWRRRWRIIAAAVLLGLLCATAVSAFTRPQYTSTSQLFVTTTGGASVVEAYQGNLFGQERVNSYAKLAASRQVAQRAIDQLQINMSADELMSRVAAKPVPNTVMLDVSVSAPNPDLARDLTNAVALQTTQVVEQLETSARGGSPAATASMVDEAVAPSAAAIPNWPRNLIVGGLAGLLLGLVAAIARDKLAGSVVGPSDTVAAAGADLIGSVPRAPFDSTPAARPGTLTPAATEAFRAIRTSVIGAGEESPTGALVVAGPAAGAGATTVSLGLATAAAEMGRSVVVVDCDLRDHGLSTIFGCEDSTGLSDLLAGSATSAGELAVRTDTKNLFLLPAGTSDHGTRELLAADSMSETIKQLASEYDLVVLDGSPLLPYSDSIVFANWTDGVLLVARAGKTSRDDIAAAAAKVRTARANVYGLVLTDAD
jgi:capsular exopolysaccharide synthesis family protein